MDEVTRFGDLLRAPLASDLDTLFEQQADPAACRMAQFPARDHEAFLRHWKEIVLGDPRNLVKVIDVRGSVAGWIGSFNLDGKRMVGFWLGRDFWGRGIATLALEQFLRCEAGRPLWAHVAKSNAASLRVLEKCGFTIEQEVVDGEGVIEYTLKLQ